MNAACWRPGREAIRLSKHLVVAGIRGRGQPVAVCLLAAKGRHHSCSSSVTEAALQRPQGPGLVCLLQLMVSKVQGPSSAMPIWTPAIALGIAVLPLGRPRFRFPFWCGLPLLPCPSTQWMDMGRKGRTALTATARWTVRCTEAALQSVRRLTQRTRATLQRVFVLVHVCTQLCWCVDAHYTAPDYDRWRRQPRPR